MWCDQPRSQIKSVPEAWQGRASGAISFVRPAAANRVARKSGALSFSLTRPARLYVGFKSGNSTIAGQEWLKSYFERTALSVMVGPESGSDFALEIWASNHVYVPTQGASEQGDFAHVSLGGAFMPESSSPNDGGYVVFVEELPFDALSLSASATDPTGAASGDSQSRVRKSALATLRRVAPPSPPAGFVRRVASSLY